MKKLTVCLSFILLFSLLAVPVSARIRGSEPTPYVRVEEVELPEAEYVENVLEIPQLQDLDIDELDEINEAFIELGERLLADAEEMEADALVAMGYPGLDYRVFTRDGLFSLYWEGAWLVDMEVEDDTFRNLETFNGSRPRKLHLW